MDEVCVIHCTDERNRVRVMNVQVTGTGALISVN